MSAIGDMLVEAQKSQKKHKRRAANSQNEWSKELGRKAV
jgi:hypothetical protein